MNHSKCYLLWFVSLLAIAGDSLDLIDQLRVVFAKTFDCGHFDIAVIVRKGDHIWAQDQHINCVTKLGSGDSAMTLG